MKILVMDPLFETVPDVEEQAAGPGVELSCASIRATSSKASRSTRATT
jgi:hypothetical protein